MTEPSTSLTPSQEAFLELATQRGVAKELFGPYIPEIQFQEETPDPAKPTIMYMHTGGTLAMVPVETGSDVLTFEGAIDLPKVIEVCHNISNVRDRFNILGVYLCNIDSKEVDVRAWKAMAATVKTLYNDIDGVVIGHGTHTTEFTAAALSYALQNLSIPVVITASQIPSVGFPGSDGIPNLTGAMLIAAQGDIGEVVVYANGAIHRGTRLVKKHDSRLEIFVSEITSPIGFLGAQGLEFRPGTRRRGECRKHEMLFDPVFNESVVSLKMNPSVTPKTMEEILQTMGSSVGIVIETYGSGALPKGIVPILAERIQQGTAIFLTSSCTQSGVSYGMLNHDEDAKKAYDAGIRNTLDMTTTAAVVKLMHIMAQADLPKDIEARRNYVEREMIRKSYSGEITINRGRADF